MTRVPLKKNNSASIRLPRRGGQNLRQKPEAVIDQSQGSRRVVIRQSSPAASVPILGWKIRKRPPRAVEENAATWGFTIREIIALTLGMVLVIVLAATLIKAKSETRTLHLQMSALKQKELKLLKQEEETMQEINTYKRLENIEQQAHAQGMVRPDSERIIVVP